MWIKEYLHRTVTTNYFYVPSTEKGGRNEHMEMTFLKNTIRKLKNEQGWVGV